jgi:hypothetical protein
MMFATTAFMAAAQAQSSYPYPCANDVNKKWGGAPGIVAKAMCGNMRGLRKSKRGAEFK